jgi:hypothetical protein
MLIENNTKEGLEVQDNHSGHGGMNPCGFLSSTKGDQTVKTLKVCEFDGTKCDVQEGDVETQ